MSYVYDGNWVGRSPAEFPAIWADLLNKISRRFECIGSEMASVTTNSGAKKTGFTPSDFSGIQARDKTVITTINTRLNSLHAGSWVDDPHSYSGFGTGAIRLIGWAKDPNSAEQSNYWAGISEMVADGGGNYSKFTTLDNYNAHFLMGCQYALDRLVYPILPVKRIDTTDGFSITRNYGHVRKESHFDPDPHVFYNNPRVKYYETDGVVAYGALAPIATIPFDASNGDQVFLLVEAGFYSVFYATSTSSGYGSGITYYIPGVYASQVSKTKSKYIVEGPKSDQPLLALIVKEITCGIVSNSTFKCVAEFGDTVFDGTGLDLDPVSFLRPSNLERKETGLGIGLNTLTEVALNGVSYAWPFGTEKSITSPPPYPVPYPYSSPGPTTFNNFGNSGVRPYIGATQYTLPDGRIVTSVGTTSKYASRVNLDIRSYL